MTDVPNYLKDHAETYKRSPHQANLEWFANARFGLFLHYGLYSQLARGEWVMHHEKIPADEYAKLAETFDPSGFDAEFIADLAVEAGMSYVNLTACHHEGFCLWGSKVEPFNSVNVCGRDLVGELAAACDARGLGFFAYFTHCLNWRLPFSDPQRHPLMGGQEAPPPSAEEIAEFWRWSHGCIREICQLPVPLAGVWLDIIRMYYTNPERVPIEQTYELIGRQRPEALIAFKQGATGTEDFASPERSFRSLGEPLRKAGLEQAAQRADAAWEANRHKHNEICMTLQRGAWGYQEDAEHLDADALGAELDYAGKHNCNLLANTGPLPDGSIHPDDVASLREVGRRLANSR